MASQDDTEALLQFLVKQLRNACRRFLVGFTLNSGFTLLQHLFKYATTRKPTHTLRHLIRKILLNRESFSLGAFMSCFGLVYQCVRRFIQGATPSRLLAATVAGLTAGVSIHTLSASSGTHLDPTELSLHTLVRAIEALARQTPLAKALNHIDAAIFIASCTLIMYCWFFHPEALTPEYRRWITRMANMDKTLLDLLRQLKDGRIKYGVHTHALDDYCDRNCIPRELGDPGNGFVACSVVHPLDGSSCTGNSARRALRGFKSAMSLYLPVHLVAQLLVHRKRLFYAQSADGSTSPSSDRIAYLAQCGLRALTAAMRSSAFLGTFIGLAWGGVCLARQTRKDDLPSGPLLGSFLSGWSIFLEAPHRRGELAAYVAPRAIHTAWHRLEQKGWVVSVPGAHVSIFACASALMLLAYEYNKIQREHDSASIPGEESDEATSLEPGSLRRNSARIKAFSPTLGAIIELFTN